MSSTADSVVVDLAERAQRHPGFNSDFLIFLLLCAGLAIFFLLYFNRIVASAVSYAIRTWTWHKHRIYIDINALQISLLGGRIFFTGLRYHGSNETFFIQHGYITWRYWLRRVRDVDILTQGSSSETTEPAHDKREKLPCRVTVNLIGVEWFVYNRSPAYNSIIDGLSESLTPDTAKSTSSSRNDGTEHASPRLRKTQPDNATEKSGESAKPISASPRPDEYDLPEKVSPERHAPSRNRAASDATRSESLPEGEDTYKSARDLPFMLQLFPIHIECEKAAAVIGNENTKGVFVVRADSVGADIDASKTQTVDLHRQIFNIEFNHPVVQIRENEDFKMDQTTRATGEGLANMESQPPPKPNVIHRWALNLSRLLHRLRRRLFGARRVRFPDPRDPLSTPPPQVPGANNWQGLSRYLDDQELDDKARWSSVEYAAESTILDSPEATLVVYWDAVSKVTTHACRHPEPGPSNRINGSRSPAWGMHFTIKGGVVSYGPWADRRRADLQRVFFPTLSKDATPATPLPAGAWRTPTEFRVDIDLEETVVMRVPFREPSKNWRWRGQEPQLKQQKPRSRRDRTKDTKGEAAPVRPSAWLEVKLAPNSSVAYSMDMLASSEGYSSKLDIELPSTELRSAVNQDLLWKSGAQHISCDLSNPLSWNSLRQWRFDIQSDNLELYILRDHIFLLTDLIDDWSSGPPPEYLAFTPFKYLMNLNLKNLQLYLNVNDANIIDNATAMDENAYLILSSPLLTAKTTIPIDKYRPDKNVIPFDLQADTLDITFNAPQWNTVSAFAVSNEIGRVRHLVVGGKYHYNATTSPANTDTLVLNVHGRSAQAYLHGFVVRFALLLKDNYFGDNVHFRTLNEYQEHLQLKDQGQDAQPTRAPNKKSNDLDVMLGIKLENPKFMIPTNLYSSSNYVEAELADMSVDLRFTNYYMDLELALSPLSLSLGSLQGGLDSPNFQFSSTQLFIDGVRVYGHRLFGLPPTEPTYLCNWDVAVGAISGECSGAFLAALARGGAAFGFTFDDVENALVPYSSLVFDDITFARIRVESVKIWLHVDEAAFLFSTDAIDVTFDDWANSHYSKKANICIPNVELSCINSESAARHKSRHQYPTETHAYFRTDLRIATIGRKLDFSEKRKLQQELVQREDQRTNRTPFLLRPEFLSHLAVEQVDPPAQCSPTPPHPVPPPESERNSLRSSTPSRRSQSLRHQSSFLSLSASSTHSVQRSRSRHRAGNITVQKPREGQVDSPSSYSYGARGTFPGRNTSVSTGRDSALYWDTNLASSSHDHHHHTSVTFSSQYYTPHFALDGVQPNTRELPLQEHDEGDRGDFLSNTIAELDDVDPDGFSQDHSYNSILLEFPNGLTGFLHPTAVKHTTSLIAALQPKDPEEILDSLQTGAMGKVFGSKKKQDARGTTTDFLLRLPKASVRILHSSSLDSPDPSQEELDQYDLLISNVGLVTRSVSDFVESNTEATDARTSLHLTLGSAEFSASERLSSVPQPQAAMVVQVEDAVLSVGTKDVTYIDGEIGSILGSTSSGRIEYLASLIHRTGSLVAELEHLVGTTISRHDNQLKYFMHRLLEEGLWTTDPSFLVRPSAVLRSAPSHLRTYDSWKLAMRLRQIWSTMDYARRAQMIDELANEDLIVPPNASELVISAFERWRNWDLESVAGSILVQNVYGPLSRNGKQASTSLPMRGACRLARLQLVLDPGPKQNKIGLVDISARIDKQDKLNELGVSETLLVLTIICEDASVNLNWELCELVEDILRLYNQAQAEGKLPDVPRRKATPAALAQAASKLHVVVEVAKGSLEAEAINLRFRSQSHGFKASGISSSGNDGPKVASIIYNCDTIKTELSSHSDLLAFLQLREPSIFLAHELQNSADETSLQSIKATASSQDLQVVIKQDPIGLMEVFELLLQDEVAQLLRLKKQIPVTSQPQAPIGMAERLSNFRFNIVMFLDQYSINVTLLQSLSYKISGVVARAACTSHYGHDITFDFDIKENSHETQINVKNEPRRISLMQIPPTNGRITSEMGGGEHVLTVLSSVELMQLDASAVYSLLAALNRPQVSSTIEDMKVHSKAVQKRINDVFGSQEEQDHKLKGKSDSKSNLVYNVHLTLAGLQVSALTPFNSPTEPISQLLFFLDKVHLQASNRPNASLGPPVKYPELHFNIKQIGVDIRRGQRDMLRSCGSFGAGITVSASSQRGDDGTDNWNLDFRSFDLVINLSPETVSTAVGVLGYLRDKIKDLDTSRELSYLRKLRQSKPRIMLDDEEVEGDDEEPDFIDSVLGVLGYHFELQNIRVCWIVASEEDVGNRSSNKEDLVLSIKLIQFANRTKKSARLTIKDFQLQTVPPGHDRTVRSVHSALLPEVIFNIGFVSTPNARRMAFQAVGQSLDLRITSGFIVPAANLANSISLSAKNVQEAYAGWDTEDASERADEPATKAVERPWNLVGKRRLESLLIDADFAGATVHVSSKRDLTGAGRASKGHRPSLAGKYGQFSADDTGSGAVLESPGLAWKVEFRDDGHNDPNLSGEIKINASKNTLYPSVVPLIIEILSSVKEVVSDDSDDSKNKKPGADPPKLRPDKTGDEENILTADPSAVLGRMRLDLGLRICRQDFSLSCQPIAQVAATMCFDSIYFTANTVTSNDQGNFFAISGTFTNLQASVQHVYSRESTASFDIETITLSFMNSKHVSGTSGVSAILNVSPMKISINAKQVQDFLLFREIWYPEELRRRNTPQVAKLVTETSQGHLVQKYQQVAATAAFPWTASISIVALDVNVDLGQAIGKSVFEIADFWVSSKKTSDWEQSLCLGFKKIGVECTGRLSGFVALQDFKLRTSIQWPEREEALNGTPLVQASLGLHALRLKAAFDYQAFLVADIRSLEFLMYNVRHSDPRRGDRLVAILDGEAVQVFGTTTSTSQAIALYQAIKKLIQERRGNFEASLKEIEKFMKRKSSSVRYTSQPSDMDTPKSPEEDSLAKSPISLDTDVVVTLKALNIGVFPSNFYDHQVFKIEALNAFARFAASIEAGQIHSILKMTLGQLRIGLAGVRSTEAPKALSEIEVQDVVRRATGSRGGTILKVPQVSAVMETWQKPDSKMIDYIFKSAFQGKVEVGWNYSRISFIRSMWANHTKSLEQTWGRELPMAAAVKITGVPESDGEHRGGEQQKITAEVNVPQSKYNYQALEPAIIETPQLRDMGEATPPLEWIGLHRDKLPNLTHQIVIVSLLELAGEVEDAYSRILGVS